MSSVLGMTLQSPPAHTLKFYADNYGSFMFGITTLGNEVFEMETQMPNDIPPMEEDTITDSHHQLIINTPLIAKTVRLTLTII